MNRAKILHTLVWLGLFDVRREWCARSLRYRALTVYALLAMMLVTVTCSAADFMEPVHGVQLADGRVIDAGVHHLFTTSKESSEREPLLLPTQLRHVLSRSTEIIFPESRAIVIGGHTYLLAVVSQASSHTPMAYCGSGNESILYVLQLHSRAVAVSFSQLVQSCLKNIELDSDGTKSPLASIAWNRTHDGFDIDWMTDAHGTARTVRYRLRDDRFVAEGAP